MPVLAALGPACRDCCSACFWHRAAQWHPGTACPVTPRALGTAIRKCTVLERSLIGLRNLFLVCCNTIAWEAALSLLPTGHCSGGPVLNNTRHQKCRGDKSEQVGDLCMHLCFSMCLFLGQIQGISGPDISHPWMGNAVPLMYSLTRAFISCS